MSMQALETSSRLSPGPSGITKQPNATWNEEREAHLRKRWAEGATFSEIAKELGVTRSSAIGKAHRLKLGNRGRTALVDGGKQTSKRRRQRKETRITKLRVAFEDMPITAAELQDIPIEQRRTIIDICHDHCRFPFGDPLTPEFFFCGGKAIAGMPYCAPHAKLAYEIPRRG